MFQCARKSLLLGMSLLTAVACVPSASAQGTPTPGQNVNMVSGTKWPGGDPFLQRQNEPSIAVSTRNPQHLLAGANDYRTVDLNLVDQLPINQLAGDAWLGVFKSFDGGQRWQSTLLPGFPQDGSSFGTSSPMKGFAAASDPLVRAGTNGMFYYSSIALNRNTNIGGLFLARFIDLNNKENGDATQSCSPGLPCIPAPTTDPIRYLNTVEIDAGNAGQFIDKPWIAVDIPRSGAGTCVIQDNSTTVTQSFPAGNVYMAYAMFVGGTINIRSKINFVKSSDCGATWTKPIMISQTYDINQGTQVAVDPETGNVYVAWRTFSGTGTDPDAIVVAKSTDFGNTFTKAVPVRSLMPYNPATPTAAAFFDQNTSTTEFRTQSMPTIAVDDSGMVNMPGNVYVAWSERGVGLGGDARIQISTSADGMTWSAPMPVDNNPLTDDSGSQINGGRGHQLMPAMTFIEGQLMLVYYDLRLDHTTGVFTPNVSNGSLVPDAKGQFFEENRPNVGDSSNAVFTPFVDDANPPITQRRHTIDVMLSQSSGGLKPSFTRARVSRYDFGQPGLGDTGIQLQQLEQLKVNPPNLPMFSQGMVPFMGDYIDVAGQMFVPVPPPVGGWTFNNPVPSTASGPAAAVKPAAGSPVHYSAWTTNQDVIPPPNGDWTQYRPISSGISVFNGTATTPCQPNMPTTFFESDRNQNIYDSRITQGLLVTTPQNSKPLLDKSNNPIQRAFAILLQNSTNCTSSTNCTRYFQLTIANQPPGNFQITGQTTAGGYASFQQALPNQPLVSPLPAPVTKVNVAMVAHSGAVRTVFVLSNVVNASVSVNVNETDQNGNVLQGGLSSFLVLNADPSAVAALAPPDGSTTDPNSAEIYDPNITAPNITAPNITAPNITAPNITAPNITAPNITAPNITAPNITAPNITATNVTNPNITAPNITAGSIADATYTVTNTGNTNGEYHVKLAGGASGSNAKVPLQLTVNQVYTTPTSYQCTLIPQQQNITFVNVLTPEFTPINELSNPNITAADPSDATIYLAPGDSALITLRGQTDIATMQSIVTQIAPVVVPQAVDTNSTATTPTVIAPLFITTPSSLPDGVAPVEGTRTFATLSAIGGNLSPTSVGTWTLIGAPASLSLSSPASFTPGNPGTSSVTLSGNPAVGTYTFTAQVQDSASPTPNTATRQFTLRIAAPLMITTASPLPMGTQGTSYGPVTLTATGGTQPLTWTTPAPAANLNGLTLSSSGVLSGAPAITGTFTFTVTVSDNGDPAQSASSLMAVSVVPATPPAPPSSTLLCDTFNFATVTQQVGGPPNPTKCTLSNTTKITQLATYHFNGGNGATPGTMSLQLTGGKTFGPFTATGFAGQSGPNEAWVATPNVTVPAGTITVIDSGTDTWSFNPGSNNAGFVRLWGFANSVTLTFVTQPTNTVAGLVISPAVQVKATDSTGAALSSLSISLSISSNPGGGTLTGTTTANTDSTGVATFSNLSIDKAGSGYTLLASSLVGSVTSNPFSISNPVPVFFGQAVDPVDGGTNPDLVWGSITVFNNNTVKLSVRFAAGTFNPANTEALFFLDTDQNVSTGRPGIDGACSAPDSGLIGGDYFVDLASGFDNNQGFIYKATAPGGPNTCSALTFVGNAPVTIFSDGMDITFPLTMLTNTAGSGLSGPATAGPWNFKVTTDFNISPGSFSAITDRMPKTGLAPAFTASAPLPITPPPSGMVAWYPGDGYPTDIQNNHGGVFTNITYAPSEVGQSFAFDGLSSAITIADAPDLTPASLTVDFWFKSNVNLSGNPNTPFLFKLNPGDDANFNSKGYDFFYQFGGPGFGLAGPGGLRFFAQVPAAFAAGTWHHVAGTYDPTAPVGTAQRLYLDGTLVSSTCGPSTTGPTFNPSSTNCTPASINYQPAAIEVGRVINSANFPPSQTTPYFFNGQIDEIEIFNRVLSASEIQAIFNAGSAGKAKP